MTFEIRLTGGPLHGKVIRSKSLGVCFEARTVRDGRFYRQVYRHTAIGDPDPASGVRVVECDHVEEVPGVTLAESRAETLRANLEFIFQE